MWHTCCTFSLVIWNINTRVLVYQSNDFSVNNYSFISMRTAHFACRKPSNIVCHDVRSNAYSDVTNTLPIDCIIQLIKLISTLVI